MKKIKKYLIGLLIALLVTGCSYRKASETDDINPSNNYNKPSNGGYIDHGSTINNGNYYDKEESNNVSIGDSSELSIKKIIVTANIDLQTYDLNESISLINEMVNKYNGYIQSSSTYDNSYSRSSSITVRIPADKFDEFIADSTAKGNVTHTSISTDDITDSYYDLQARLDSLTLQLERVKEFYQQATTIEELIAIEDRISEIQSEINCITVRLKNYDLLTNYSTVNFSITEVVVYTEVEESFFAELARAFTSSFTNFVDFIEDLVLDIVYSFWFILFFGLVIFGLVKLNKKKHFIKLPNPFKKNKTKALEENKQEETE